MYCGAIAEADVESKLRVGIAGFGSVTRQIIPGIVAMPGIELTAVAAPREGPREEARTRYGVQTYATVEAMCSSSDVDVVWVCTPNMFHAEHTIAAAEHGKHVICEKPMAVTLEEAQAMVEAINRNGVRYVQGHSKLFDPPVRRMREIVSSGELGRVIQVNTWEYKPWISGQPRRASEYDTSQGGGVLYRQGPHQVDVVRGIAGGMVRSVRAVAGRWHPDFPLGEGDYTAFLEFEDGTAATMAFNGYGYFDITELTWGIGEGGQQRELDAPAAQRFAAPAGAAAIDQWVEANTGGARAERGERRRFQPFYGLTLVSCERGDIRQSPDGLYVYTEAGREEAPVERGASGRAELIELQAALREDRATFPGEAWGMATLEVLTGILDSSRERREVSLSHQVPCAY